MSLDAVTILIVIAAALSILVAIIALMPGQKTGGNARAGKRIRAILNRDGHGAPGQATASKPDLKDKRKALKKVLESIEGEGAAKAGKVPTHVRLERAGLHLSPRAFYIASGCLGAVSAVLAFALGFSPVMAILAGLSMGAGVPNWLVQAISTRRQKAFGEDFANAIDIIVRGVKSGLPIGDCLKIIANESPAPVGPEFKQVVEGQAVGLPLDQALMRLLDRMPIAEVNFFVTVLQIQSKTGGNLSEALDNLANVLRSRKALRGKVTALSSEARTSAMIIGALPFLVMTALYLTSPDYIGTLFADPRGHLMLAGAAVWMTIGIFVMWQMISFKY